MKTVWEFFNKFYLKVVIIFLKNLNNNKNYFFHFTALVATYGDVNAAIDRLLGAPRPEGNQQSWFELVSLFDYKIFSPHYMKIHNVSSMFVQE